MNNTLRTGALAPVLALVLAPVLAGCAGGSAAPAVPGTGTSSTTASTTPAATTTTTSPPVESPPVESPSASSSPSSTVGAAPPSGVGTGGVGAGGVAAGQLPRGGSTVFPAYRLFGYSGAPGSAAFGRLGTGDLDARVREIERKGKAYAGGRKVLPVLELITVVVDSQPGADGDYNRQVSDATIRQYLAAARRHRALLLLDVQPGRDDFLTLAKQLEPWLRQPDVGLALDPEWAVEKGQVPGQTYGRTTGAELDRVAAYLDGLVRAHRLPQKVMVFHQVAAKVVRRQEGLRSRPGVVVIKSVDGIGSRGAKTATWQVLVKGLPRSIHPGFKLFYDEDTRHGPLMTPAQVLALKPTPEYVLIE